MTLTEKEILEIAQELECGMVCFYHRPTGKIECHPDPEDPYFDSDLWQDIIEVIEEDWDNYDKFEKMDSSEEFQVMENFAYSIADSDFRAKIINCLSQRKPFRNFKNLIDFSDYREQWFEFKKNAYNDFVKEQVEGE